MLLSHVALGKIDKGQRVYATLRTELTYVIDRDSRTRAVKGYAWTMARNLLEGESIIRARGNKPHRMIATHGMADVPSGVGGVLEGIEGL
jgi:hypothetical protein